MIAIKDKEMPNGCQHCMYFRKHLFGNGLDYSYSCILGATHFPYPWIRQMEERGSDCPLVEIVTCKDCKYYKEIPLNSSDEIIATCKKNKDRNYHFLHPNFYCADGERRE